MDFQFDVVVVGGGHSGIEATWIAAQFGLKVGLVSLPNVPIGEMPCNPAVGGVGKGQVVREIDSLGGLMGSLTDLSAIQCRILNESKGYAVQSTRMQVDKDTYAKLALDKLSTMPNITLVSEKVTSINEVNGFTLTTESGSSITSSKVIITTGTFLNGLMHCGEESEAGGVIGMGTSSPLSEMFPGRNFGTMRFKTGTPPRLSKKTIDFSVMVEQDSDSSTRNFHWDSGVTDRTLPQISCHLTNTNEETLGIIRDNKERSPIFNGRIKGVGPRYCPSIEDKAFRYPDRNKHHVFVEPEGLDTDSIYPNGLSTSLPKDIQESYIKSIPGLENTEILVYGYAVEYDVIDTSLLNQSLEHTEVPGLYFAGQVNGTSGYEEAAGQGIMAGINAALAVQGREPLILDRNDSYIGVLVEDLVSNKRDEPYRLFTARSENRLYVREDNVINRMFPYRQSLFIGADIDRYQENYIFQFELLSKMCDSTLYKANAKTKEYFIEMGYGPMGANLNLSELIKRSHLDPVEVLTQELINFGVEFEPRVIYGCAISKKYEGYITRANQETEKIKRLGKKKINWRDLHDSPNISYECRQRILAIKPETFSQLQRIEGIRPATLAFVAGNHL